MTELKRLVILANSIKHLTGACIAGREIITESDRYYLGSCFRSVNYHGESELASSECILTTGKAHRDPKRFYRRLVVEYLAKHRAEIRAEYLT
jgi:hypothetical protein